MNHENLLINGKMLIFFVKIMDIQQVNCERPTDVKVSNNYVLSLKSR